MTTEIPQERQESRNAAWKVAGVVGAVIAVLVVVGLLVFLLLGNVLKDTVDQGAPDVTDLDEGAVSEQEFTDVSLGNPKEDVLRELRPAMPVDSRVLDRYQQRSPETVQSSCVYYESVPDGAVTDALYRFCFVEDELVAKDLILPDEPSTG